MKIVQATFGVFHHFELARELEARGHLERIFSTFPWTRLRREGLPREKVSMFPWLHSAQILLGKRNLLTPGMVETFGYRNATTFDSFTLNRVPECDALIALSGACLRTGKLVQERGGKFLCDRGSTHRRFQANLIREEHRIWKQEYRVIEERETAREDEIYALADAIVVPSKVARQSFLDFGHDPERVHVIPYGVRLEKFTKMGNPPAGPGANFEVLFVGSVSLRKGLPYLLQAFAGFRHPKKRLRIIGGVSPKMREFLAGFPQEHVEFLGALPQPELVRYMSESHVMVLPSIEEGLALVQGQALACGCPIIASTATGSGDLFTDGVEGFIVEPRSVDAIVDRLQRLVDEPELRGQMSAAAVERAKAIGGWNSYGDQWEALLYKVTGAGKFP